MYRVSLVEAILAAREFIKRSDKCLEDSIRIRRSKESGAMVRASLELTRKLADLRQNR